MSEKKAVKENAVQENNNDGGVESIQKVERIRDIVFGAQMRDYDQRFSNIGRDISRIQQEMASANEKILGQIKALDGQIRELNDRLSARAKEQGQQLTTRIEDVESQQGAKLRELDTRLSARLHEQEESLAKQAQALRANGDEQIEALQRTVSQLGEELRNEMRDHAERLSDAKTDRVTLGQMLVQVGNDLQQGASNSVFSQLLDELA